MKSPLIATLATILLVLPSHAALVGYWSADDGAGTTLTNNEGTAALDGTLRADANWTADSGGHTGMPGDFALEFGGLNSSAVDITGMTNTWTEVTITGWINPDVTPAAWTGLLGSRNGGPNQIGFGFRNNTGNLVYTWNGNSNTTWDWDSGLNVPLNEWSFVAVRITATEATINLGTAGGGLVSAVNTIPHAAEAGGNWAMGIDDCCGTSRNFDGLYDDFAIWDEALNDQQIESIFNGTSPLAILDPTIGSISLAPAMWNPLGPEDLHVLASAAVGTTAGFLQAQNATGGAIPNTGVTYSLPAGVGDNDLFAIGGPESDQIVTGADLSGAGATQYTITVRGDDGGVPVDVALTINVGADTDADDLLDGWEELFAPGNLPLLSGGTDNEPDGLTSGEEYLLRTDPTDADSDDDGLDDGGEQAAGTDPFDTDSDDDGLSDGDEVNGSPATDPLDADSDDDGFSDSAEIAAGTDPNDPNSNPTALLAYWPADEGSGTTLANAGGDASLDGTLTDGSWGAGHTGNLGDSAFEVTGINTSTVAAPPTGESFSRITITGWVNGVPTGDWTGLIQARAGGGPPIGIGFRGGSGELTYTWNDNNANTYNFVSGLAVPQNEWAFVALVLDPDQATLYVGSTGAGAALNSATNAIPHLTQANDINTWNFGIDACCGTARNWSGLMDDISIWNGTLSEEQIEALWDQSKTPLTLFGPSAKSSFSIVRNAATDELVISWDSVGGKLYNVRSQTDPSASDPIDWPIFAALHDLPATPPLNTLTIPMPPEAERYFVIEEFNAPPVTIFSDDLESGQGDWVTGDSGVPIPPNEAPSTPTATKWELGAPDAGVSGGPPAAQSGTACFGTDLDASYVEDTGIFLRSPAVDLTNFGGGTLKYWRFYDIEAAFDRGRVRVLDAADDSEIAVLEDVIDGTIPAWEQACLKLPPEVAGKTVKFEFTLASDNFNTNPQAGFYLDDVQVTVP